ncbi:hypothetical protein LCGC14_0665460 [marine sediment metagenome]|uniref:DUF4031 domain-containing protein n=1 Tax=marine sediment metagenome TaxID=412755 RepID=A0A0F9QSD7_9ZZZZ
MILMDAKGHLVSDSSLAELHDFAARIGMRRSWFQLGQSGQHPHYDITVRWRRRRAHAAGAVQVRSKELVGRMVRR